MRIKARPASRRGSDTWQTIYMDLMTIIMVFFVILWSITQSEEVGVSQTIGDETVKMVNLPGDVLFSPGQAIFTPEGKSIVKKLFDDPSGTVLQFADSGLTKRMLVIHGHTDSDGPKDDNFELGYQRALAAYKEIRQYSEQLPDHAVICTHADNSAAQFVPKFEGKMTRAEYAAVKEAKQKNRRITIEDKVVNRYQGEEEE